MHNLNGKTAFITGGASGIGLAMAFSFGRRGANVMIADVETKALEAAAGQLRAEGIRTATSICDVSDRDAVQRAADATIAAFGKIHLVCNNAGVSVTGALGTISQRDWDWILGVNLRGAIHGMDVFTPLIEAHGEGGYFVNTASMGGMIASATHEPYIATKFALVGMSEGWAEQLRPKGIGMIILCPGFVRTRIFESRRNRAGGADKPVDAAAKAAVEAGIPAGHVAEMVVEAMRDGDLYVFTNPEFEPLVRARFDRILAAFEKPKISPALKSEPT